ncbi:NAD(P)H-quinone oxidoreductase [Methylomonas methanica]|uniref:NAD(P)H quinone oxidoreductase, PIG3 family n=1 Tax=Methylomonas methanica (strain DSM 25384 / MC09) TaxID=857087 RepID=G0A5V2_METMM|nr:NAD(P)H-quinone oxidoreductase [Methylomonas methanica]AEF99229.1 NAD(P)H quinone oxidoreductase, PIG3 family [Methylomonas methanica MC09]
MRAIEIVPNANGNALKLCELPMPVPNDFQVLIEVKAAGVNRPDIMQRQGVYPPPAGASPILGLEVAGIVVETGAKATTFKPGDAVCALLTGGGYAEYCLASEACCLPMTSGFTFTEAAALPETFFTVWSNVFERGRLAFGESLLVHGGGSGIGTTAIQLAKAFDHSIYITAGSDEKCQRCLDLGADAAINYRQQDFVEIIHQLTRNHGVDVILDMIGGDYLPRNLKCLAVEGRLVQIAIQNGPKSEINLWQLMLKRQTITGSTLRGREDSFKGNIALQLRKNVWPLLEAGKLKPSLDSVFPLADAEQAHTRMTGNQHFGKIVLEI